MGQPAARVGDMHVCPMVTPGVPPIPHVGGPILPPGAINVLIGGMPAATVGTMCLCVGPPDVIIRGSFTVLIGGRPAARMGDMTAHGGSIIIGCPTVLIGDFGMGGTSEPIAPGPDDSRKVLSTGGASTGSGLGDDVDKLIAKSPTLKKELENLKKDGWKIEYGPAGGGSNASRKDKIIKIDSSYKVKSENVTRSISHEAGHALYPYKSDVSSKEKFMNGTLADEGAATLNNIRVQREIKKNGGSDITISGNPANHKAYNESYDKFEKDGDEEAARNKIGSIYAKGETASGTGDPAKGIPGKTYEEYYGGWYDENYPKKK